MNHIISWLVWIVFISSILDKFESFHFVGSERSEQPKNFHFEPTIERLNTHIYWDQMKNPFKTYSIQLQKKITRKSTHRCVRLTGLTGFTGLTGSVTSFLLIFSVRDDLVSFMKIRCLEVPEPS